MTNRTSLFVLLPLLVLAGYLAWKAGGSGSRGVRGGGEAVTAGLRDVPPRSDPVLEAGAARKATRRTILLRASEVEPEPSPVPAPRLVRVHGKVRRWGQPVADCDLVFRALAPGRDRRGDDWDFTDLDGCFEIRLLPGRYAVLEDDGGPWVANLSVPGNREVLEIDLDLP